jgi:hypothetical protein
MTAALIVRVVPGSIITMESPEQRANTADVEKRWGGPADFRIAAGYAMVVTLAAAVVFYWYATHDRYSVGWAVATPIVLFIGGAGAMGKTFLQWRSARPWPLWQGAGWFLLTLSLLALTIPSMGLNRPA